MKLADRKTEFLALGFILILGFIFRFYNYASFSLSNDELSAIYRCNYTNLHDLISQGVGIDFHPAGVQVFLYYWIKAFGNSEASVRLPFVIFGSLAILFTYLFSRRWFGAAPALFAAAAIAFLKFPIDYSQIARPYASGLMLSMLLAWLWSIVLLPKEKEKKQIWLYAILLGIAFALNLYNHYFSGLLAFIIGISAIAFLNKTNVKPYLTALLFGSLLFAPHIPMTLHHMSKGGLSSWLGAPSWRWPIWHIRTIFTTYFTIFLVLVTVVYIKYKSTPTPVNTKIRTLLLIFFLLPFALGFFYSLWVNPVLQNSVLIFSMPFLIVYIFSFLPQKLNTKSIIGLLIVSGTMIYSSFFLKVHSAVDIQNFKGISKSISKWQKTFPLKNTLWFMESNSPNYINYYLKDDTTKIQFAQWIIRDEQELMQLKNILDTSKATNLNFVLLAPRVNLAYMMMANKFPYRSNFETPKAPNAQVYYLSKTKEEHSYAIAEKKGTVMAKYKMPHDSTFNLTDIEYSPGLEYHIQNNEDNLNLIVKMHIISHAKQSKAHLVFAISYPNKNKNSYWGSVALRYFLKANKAQDFFFIKQLPKVEEGAIIKVYLWNPEHEAIEIKKLEITLFKMYYQ